jgi:transcriptional regulator CtsR
VESRRGGGGYIRIVRLSLADPQLVNLIKGKERRISRQNGELLVKRLVEEDFLTSREGMIIVAMLDDPVLEEEYADAETLRGVMLNTLLINLLREDFI